MKICKVTLSDNLLQRRVVKNGFQLILVYLLALSGHVAVVFFSELITAVNKYSK